MAIPDSNNTRSYCAVPGTVTAADDAALREYARVFSLAVRSTYARQESATRGGTPLTTLEQKQHVQATFGLTSRQANAVRVEADGKRAAQKELDKRILEDTASTLSSKQRALKTALAKLKEHRAGKVLRLSARSVVALRSRIYYLQTTCAKLAARKSLFKQKLKTGATHLTFGTKKLLRQRPSYPDLTGRSVKEAQHQEALYWEALGDWNAQWEESRERQFYVLGSKDETGGCQGCVATLQENGLFTLQVRLPDQLRGADGRPYVTLTDVRVPYGAEHLRYALEQQNVRSASRKALTAEHKKAQEAAGVEPTAMSQKLIEGGAAVTWRFIRERAGWKCWFTTDVKAPAVRTNLQAGMLGLDVNAGFVSVAQVDRFGSISRVWNWNTPSRGFTAEQRLARMADVVKDVIAHCVKRGVPLALEDLDFDKKKRELRSLGLKSKQKLMALAYAKLRELLLARASDAGVQVIFVSPAYTSTQGLVRYSIARGWSAHCGAAGVIARRALGMIEKAPVCGTLSVPLAGTAVEWTIPEDIARSDVYLRWPELHKHLKETVARYFRNRPDGVVGTGAAERRPRGSVEVVGESPTLKHALRMLA